MKITTIGLDLAKNVFHVVCCDQRGKRIQKKMLRRSQLLNFFVNLDPCLVGMEACASAHYWARQLKEQGHTVKLMPPQYVKAYVQGNKNDYNDAQAIAEAVVRPEMRFVATKTPAQQDVQALHRVRARCVKDRTSLSNQMRGLLAEYGVILPKGITVIRREISSILENAENGLSEQFRELMNECYQQFTELDDHIKTYTKLITRHSQKDEACQQLQTIPGFGPIVASVFQSTIGNGESFRRGRDVSAALGLVPRQHSSGGKNVLLGISKRGDSYTRCLLIHAARTVLIHAENKEDRLSVWATKIKTSRGFNKAVVALANKMARIGWVVLSKKVTYQMA